MTNGRRRCDIIFELELDPGEVVCDTSRIAERIIKFYGSCTRRYKDISELKLEPGEVVRYALRIAEGITNFIGLYRRMMIQLG